MRDTAFARQVRHLSRALNLAPGVVETFLPAFAGSLATAAHADINALVPGAAPFEFSFAEHSAASLRLDLEPWPGSATSPLERRQAGVALIRSLAAKMFGTHIEQALAHTASNSRWQSAQDARFGAFVGVECGVRGVHSLKLYLETGPRDVLEAGLGALVQRTRKVLPGVVPQFVSLAANAAGITQRISLLQREPWRVLDIGELLRICGGVEQNYQVEATLSALLDGASELPANSVLIGLSEPSAGCIEIKLEMLAAALPLSEDRLAQTVLRLFDERDCRREFSHWCRAMRRASEASLKINVVSLRASAAHAPLLSVYATPR